MNIQRKRLGMQTIGLLLCISSVFCFVSLISYNPHDISFWFYSTQFTSFTNWGGAWGAWIAAWLVHSFDINVYGWLYMLLYSSVCMLRGTLFASAFSLLGISLLSVGVMMYCVLHDFSWYWYVQPGGNFGQFLCQQLQRVFPLELMLLFVSSCMLMGALLIFLKPTLLIVHYVGAYFPFRTLATLIKVLKDWGYYGISTLYAYLYESISGTIIQEAGGVISFEDLVHQVFDEEKKEEKINEPFAPRENENHLSTMGDDTSFQQEVDIAASGISLQKIIYDIPLRRLFVSHHEPSSSGILDENKRLAERLEQKLERFGIQGKVVAITPGPVITFFEYAPHIDAKVSRIIALEDDLSLALEALSVRIIAPVPGTSVVGFEVANKKRESVTFADVVSSPLFTQTNAELPLALGQDVKGETVIVDLATMPHLLVAGSTGSGKSVLLNVMLASLLCKKSPDDIKLVLIDPKRLEFNAYADIPHLATPVVTDVKTARLVLKWVVQEMQNRYQHMETMGVKSLADYNQLSTKHNFPKIPSLIVIIDELADLMMTAGKDIEGLIVRIAQMARAAGIHIIVATQRPSVDVITGLLKVNFPSRIACRVISKIDSRTVLDVSGAQKLLGRGDMLLLQSNGHIKRVHGAYITQQELTTLIDYTKQYGSPEYVGIQEESSHGLAIGLEEDDDTELYHRVLLYLNSVETISVSLLQRNFRIGYNRSARLVDRLQAEGLLVPEPGGKLKRVVRAALVEAK